MLEQVKQCIKENMESDQSFFSYYKDYIMKIQDMDIENEIMPLIKKNSTDYIINQKKIKREFAKNRKRILHDISQ